MFHPVVLIDENHFWHIGPKSDDASAGKEMCGECTCQYHHKRQVEQHHRQALIQPLLDDIGKGSYGEYRP